MQDAAGAGHSEESLEVAGVVPHHGGDSVARVQSEFHQGCGETAGAVVEFAVAGANSGLVRLAGNDLDAGKELPRALQNGTERQRKGHHGAAHRTRNSPSSEPIRAHPTTNPREKVEEG